MKNLFVLVLLLVFVQTTFSQEIPDVVQTYTNAWLETDEEARMKIIDKIWLDETTYLDPAAFTTGKAEFSAMITSFQKDFPGATFVGDPVLKYKNSLTWNWRLFNADGALMTAGRDYVELDELGRILKLVGFWENNDSENENIKVVSKYYECLFKTRDFETMATLIAEGAIYNQAIGLPYGGKYTGFGEWIAMFTKSSGYFDLTIEKEPWYFTNSKKDEVIIRFTIKCISKKTGAEISMPISEHFIVKEGKIVTISAFYFDTKTFTEFLRV